jgi:hypothetical protein
MKFESDLPCFQKFDFNMFLDRLALDKKDGEVIINYSILVLVNVIRWKAGWGEFWK